MQVRQNAGAAANAISCGYLQAGGRVEHAEGEAADATTREGLRAAVVARDKARTRAVRSDPDQALALWRGLVSGRWSLLDRFVAVVDIRMPPTHTDEGLRAALTLRERQVLSHLIQGDAMKVAGYALGINASTVSTIAKSLLLKLGIRSVTDLAALVAATGGSPLPTARDQRSRPSLT